MFSQQTLILDVESFDDATADNLPRLLTGLAAHPRKARELRSSVVISFEKLGVGNFAADTRAGAFLRRVAERFPGLGYFLHGDPPTYFLRGVSTAIASASLPRGRRLMGDDVARAHAGLLQRALDFASSIGDDAERLEDLYLINLRPELMPPAVRPLAMKSLLPALLMSHESERLRKSCVKEAETLWGRKLDEFPSFAAFARAFEQVARAGS